MSTRFPLRALAPALVCAAVLTGCGGESKKASPSPTPAGLAKAAFVTQAEAICTKANATIEAQEQPTSPADILPAFAEVAKHADTVTSQLEQLAAKQADKAELDRIFLTPLRGQVRALQAFAPTLEAAVAQGAAALSALEGPDLPEADLTAMKAYGFTACVTLAEND